MDQPLPALFEDELPQAWPRVVQVLRNEQQASPSPSAWRIPKEFGRAFARRYRDDWAFIDRHQRLKVRPLPELFEVHTAIELMFFLLNEFTRGTVDEAWPRCMTVWRVRGRVQDLPRGTRRGSYSPDMGRLLGRRFAERFYRDYAFLVDRLESSDAVEALCAYEVLEDAAGKWLHPAAGHPRGILPEALCSLRVKLPQQILVELRSDWITEGFKGETVGEFMQYLARSDEG